MSAIYQRWWLLGIVTVAHSALFVGALFAGGTP